MPMLLQRQLGLFQTVATMFEEPSFSDGVGFNVILGLIDSTTTAPAALDESPWNTVGSMRTTVTMKTTKGKARKVPKAMTRTIKMMLTRRLIIPRHGLIAHRLAD
jgi:hypothetical protein